MTLVALLKNLDITENLVWLELISRLEDICLDTYEIKREHLLDRKLMFCTLKLSMLIKDDTNFTRGTEGTHATHKAMDTW